MRQSITGPLNAICLIAVLLFSGAAHAQSRWSDAPPLPSPRQEIYAITYNGKIYTAGGIADGASAVRNEFNAFDPRKDLWLELSDLPAPRHHITLSALDGAIYAVGGFSGGFPNWKPETSAYAYDLEAVSGTHFQLYLSRAVSMSP